MKLQDIARYQEMPEGKAYEFAKETPRNIRLELLCAVPTQLTIDTPDGSVTVGVEAGQRYVQFATTGKTTISADVLCAFYTSELYTVHAENLNTKFTKVANRQERNPELEKIVAQTMANQQRRQDMQMAEMQRMHEAQMARMEENANAAKQSDNEPEGDTSKPKAPPKTPEDASEGAGAGGEPAKGEPDTEDKGSELQDS